MTNHPNRSQPLPPLAASLKAYREREGARRGVRLSQRAMAEELAIPATTLRDMEQRGTSPDTHLARLAAWAIDRL